MSTLKGKLLKKFEAAQVTEKFKKREFVMYIDGKYPQSPKLQLTGAHCDMLDAYEVGEEIEVWYEIQGREYTDKKTGVVDYFTTVTAWKIQRTGTAPATTQAATPPPPPAEAPITGADDLPF